MVIAVIAVAEARNDRCGRGVLEAEYVVIAVVGIARSRPVAVRAYADDSKRQLVVQFPPDAKLFWHLGHEL